MFVIHHATMWSLKIAKIASAPTSSASPLPQHYWQVSRLRRTGVRSDRIGRCAKGLRYPHEFHAETRQSVISDEAAFDLDLPGPLVAAGFADQARRARGRTPRVFRQDRDVLSKNPAKPADPAHCAGRDRRGVLSFGYLFFAQAKKSNSLATASETQSRAGSLPSAVALGCVQSSSKQVPRLRLGMTAVRGITLT